MSSALRHLSVCFIIVALLKVSEGYGICYDIFRSRLDKEEDTYAEQLSPAKRWPTRQTRFAAPRGKRDPLIDLQMQKIVGLNVSPLSADLLEQRPARFAAPRGKRDPYDLMADDDYTDIDTSPYFSNFVDQREIRSRFGAPRGKRLREMNWATNYYFKAPRTAKRSIEDRLGYFAFPRQGRAMSFYFPRMGRTGQNTQKVAVPDDSSCCSNGVRSVYSASKGMFAICPTEQLCCEGLEERTELYQNIIITNCFPSEESKLTKLRELMTEK